MLIVVQTLEQQCHRCSSPLQNQEQQQSVNISPENKERRSATCFLEAPGPEQWSSSTEDSEAGNDSGEKFFSYLIVFPENIFLI
jgi:hypothetical protein